MSKIACALLSYNRPHYLSQTLLSIINNKNFDKFDWYFFQDNNKIKNKYLCDSYLIDYCVAHIENFPATNKQIIVNEQNEGVAKQKQKIHELYNYYDKIIVLEDDMILSPYYFKVLLAMNKQYPYYVVQASDKTSGLPKDDYKNHLLEAEFSGCHWWGYLMPYNVFKAIEPMFNEYLSIIGDDYRNRPGEIIRNKFNVQATSQDSILSKHIDEGSIKKLAMKIPRARYIGENGLHSNSKIFKKYNFHLHKQYIFDKDQIIDLENINIVKE